VVVAGVVVTVLSLQVKSVQARAEMAEQVRKQTSSLSFMLPRSREELDLFSWLGVTAGIVEEFICRGYMLWYFASFMNWWLALVVSSLIFGIGHLYQGASGVAKTTAVGLILGALYRASGALWASMVVHAAIDVLSGRAVYFAYQHEPPARQPDAA
jgi:membrane protease YdiL (CAAX protease family)